MGSIDSFGRVVSQILINGHTSHNALYDVSANEGLFIEIDSGGSLQTGTILRQSGTLNNGTLNGLSIMRAAGETGGGASNVLVGLVTADGNGNVTIQEDQNKNGAVWQQTSIGTYSPVAPNSKTVIKFHRGCSLLLSW